MPVTPTRPELQRQSAKASKESQLGVTASPAASHNALSSQIARARSLIANGQEANTKLFRNTFGLNKPVPGSTGGFGKVTGKAMHNAQCPNAQPQATAARYLPNGASAVGGAHR